MNTMGKKDSRKFDLLLSFVNHFFLFDNTHLKVSYILLLKHSLMQEELRFQHVHNAWNDYQRIYNPKGTQ